MENKDEKGREQSLRGEEGRETEEMARLHKHLHPIKKRIIFVPRLARRGFIRCTRQNVFFLSTLNPWPSLTSTVWMMDAVTNLVILFSPLLWLKGDEQEADTGKARPERPE